MNPPSPQPADTLEKRRKQIEKAKAAHLSRQLQTRLQYARLKVDHGWQKQTLNEVENLYFHHYRGRLAARGVVKVEKSPRGMPAAVVVVGDPPGHAGAEGQQPVPPAEEEEGAAGGAQPRTETDQPVKEDAEPASITVPVVPVAAQSQPPLQHPVGPPPAMMPYPVPVALPLAGHAGFPPLYAAAAGAAGTAGAGAGSVALTYDSFWSSHAPAAYGPFVVAPPPFAPRRAGTG